MKQETNQQAIQQYGSSFKLCEQLLPEVRATVFQKLTERCPLQLQAIVSELGLPVESLPEILSLSNSEPYVFKPGMMEAAAKSGMERAATVVKVPSSSRLQTIQKISKRTNEWASAKGLFDRWLNVMCLVKHAESKDRDAKIVEAFLQRKGALGVRFEEIKKECGSGDDMMLRAHLYLLAEQGKLEYCGNKRYRRYRLAK